jgi:DNA sulfur modification protein DndD
MKIKAITLNNFRVYQGKQEIAFDVLTDKNITLISGKNGFGKTSFLTSLVWCLYGKLIAEVDDRYRLEIQDAGGYANYCKAIYNQPAKAKNLLRAEDLKKKLSAAKTIDNELRRIEIDQLQSFSVELILTDVNLPSFPCQELIIRRTHNIAKVSDSERVEIIIDGQHNELSKEVGPDIFINDFLLPKEIAKFFFFDAEKIVALAETKTAEEKHKLSLAYSEVLGIKKYIELRSNLQNLRHRLAKEMASSTDKEKLEKLSQQEANLAKRIEFLNVDIADLEEEIASKKEKSNQHQERLIREGSKLTLEQFQDLKAKKELFAAKQQELKSRVKEMVELAPFALAPQLMEKVRKQLEKEQNEQLNTAIPEFVNNRIAFIEKELQANAELNPAQINWFEALIKKHLVIEQNIAERPLLEFSNEQINRFFALSENINGSYKTTFESIAKDFKFYQGQHLSITQELNQAESKEKDDIIQDLRKRKAEFDKAIASKESELIEQKADLLQKQHESDSLKKQLSELTKTISREARQQEKDVTTARLIKELDAFIHELRVKKKASLEDRLKETLNLLMHKSDFVSHVNVIIEGEMIDVELYDKEKQLIRKEGLSKGEQQLFATAMLKSLVDESSVKFPVFIDSPLQKLDKEHAQNLIQHFYPEVSEQVILFPLLGKELSSEEYNWLKDSLADVYLISNNADKGSYFEHVDSEKIIHLIEEKSNHVIH